MNETEMNLSCKSLVLDQQDPSVGIIYGKNQIIISIAEARKRAIALIRATAAAETEELIFKALVPKPKGFGERGSNKDFKMAVGLMHLIREVKPSLHKDINNIFGAKTRKGLVDYKLNSENIQLEQEEALDHAQKLLECAEAAECDSFIKKFGERYKLTKAEISVLYGEFAEHRQRLRLENLFQK